MKIRIALFTGLLLTLGTAMAAAAIHGGAGTKSAADAVAAAAQQVETTVNVTSQATPVASRILVLPRPL